MHLRLLVDDPAPAAWNMAVDEALLESGSDPVLRCYRWAPHAVSIGWFQRLADFADVPAGTPVVRRLTGGGAIHHGDELTFAVILDAARLPGPVAASYALLHDAVRDALREVATDCQRLGEGSPPSGRPSTRWCFAEPGRDDLVVGGRKLLGSAQRRIQQPRPRVLHHGSLVLRQPSLTPFVAAVADQAPAADFAQLTARLAHHFGRVLGLEPVPGELTAAEAALARRLQHDRYENPAHNGRR